MAKRIKVVGGWTGAQVKELLLKSDLHVARAVVAIHRRQTADEQSIKITKHTNRVGFSIPDARFGSSLAEQIENGKTLSDKQLACARKMVVKYRQQLARQANERFALAVAEGLVGLVAFAGAESAKAA